MVRPTKPSHLKVISGSRQPESGEAVELPIVETVPKPPSWLPNVHAKREWERLGPILVANKLLTEGGLSAFAMLCALHGKLVQLWSAGEVPVASLVSQYRNLVNDFGLTPVAQGKVTSSGAGNKNNRFSVNGNRRGNGLR